MGSSSQWFGVDFGVLISLSLSQNISLFLIYDFKSLVEKLKSMPPVFSRM